MTGDNPKLHGPAQLTTRPGIQAPSGIDTARIRALQDRVDRIGPVDTNFDAKAFMDAMWDDTADRDAP